MKSSDVMRANTHKPAVHQIRSNALLVKAFCPHNNDVRGAHIAHIRRSPEEPDSFLKVTQLRSSSTSVNPGSKVHVITCNPALSEMHSFTPYTHVIEDLYIGLL